MCNFYGKKAGTKMISKDERADLYKANSDGCGVMWTDNGQVHYAKGFLSNDEFEKFLMALDVKHGLDNLALVLHYRISTTTKGFTGHQTHPHHITTDVKKLKQLRGSADVLFCHNGSMNQMYDYNSKEKLSDTQNFSIEILSMFKEIDPEFYKKQFYQDRIKRLTSANKDKYNRFIFLDKDGEIYTVGDVVVKQTETGTVYYANSNHETWSTYEQSYYMQKEEKPLMTLNKWTCNLPYASSRIAVKNKYGQDMYFITNSDDDYDAFGIDIDNNVYRIVEHLGKYELLEGHTAYYKNTGELVTPKKSEMFVEKIVEFDVELVLEQYNQYF